LKPVANQLGWQPAPGETDQVKSLRARVLFGLGYVGRDPETLEEARKRVEAALEDRAPIDPTLASVAFNLAALNGDAHLYQKIQDGLKTTKTPQDYYRLMFSLADFDDAKLLQRTLEFALSPEVRRQDRLSLIGAVIQNPSGTGLGWDFVRSHWQKVAEVEGGFAAGTVIDAASAACDAGLRASVKDFFATHEVAGAERTLQQSLERIDYCLDLKARQSDQLASWLQHHGRAAGGE